MWISIITVVFVIFLLSILYLGFALARFGFVCKYLPNKKIRVLLCIAAIAAISAVLWLFMGFVNMAVCVLHLVIIWLIADGCGWIINKIRKRKPKRYIAGIAAAAITFVYLFCGYVNAVNVVKTEYTIVTEKNIPGGSLKIAGFSDSHIGTLFSGRELSKYISQINEQNPDIVVIAGDFADDDTSREDMEDACKALGDLDAKYGVYYVFGNHDKGYFGGEYRTYGKEELICNLEKNNVTVLEDRNVNINENVFVSGRKDKSDRSRLDASELTADMGDDDFTVMIDHQPSDYENEAMSKADLVISGHTHGGQFFPILRAGEWMGANDMTYGHKKINETDFIVSSGIADWSLKFKTGCVSEYIIVNVVSGAK